MKTLKEAEAEKAKREEEKAIERGETLADHSEKKKQVDDLKNVANRVKRKP